jgi:uncharacterized protein YlxW (UPF0749 family)
MGNELADFLFRHFFGMLLVVKENEAPDPANVSALGAQAEMLDANNSSDLIQEFRRVHRSDLSLLKGNLSGTIDAGCWTPDNTTKSALAPRIRGIIRSSALTFE